MQTFIRTKVRIPDVPVEYMVRPRLVHLLQQGLQRRLTLVVAPAGYGKTSLMAHWLHARVQNDSHNDTQTDTHSRSLDQAQECLDALPASVWDGARAVWYGLDPSDDDPTTFLAYLTHALHESGVDIDPAILDQCENSRVDFAQLAHTFLCACTALQQQAIIVLDDYHLINSPAIHALVGDLVRYATKTIHFVLITRADPPLNIARLRAHDEITELRLQDLRFNRAETGDLLHSWLGESIAQQIADTLMAQTEGWIVGLQLSAIAARDRSDISRFIEDIQQYTSIFVIDYLVDEVLAVQPPLVRRFLLATSILNRFNDDLAATVTAMDVPTVRQIINSLRQNNLFIINLDHQHEWMRYHQQFQEMLRHRLRFQTSSAEQVALHCRAGEWLATYDHLAEAIAHFEQGDAWTRAAVHVERALPAMQNGERFRTIDHWLGLLPQDVIEQRPALLIARIWQLLVRDAVDAVPPLLQRLYRLLLADAPEPLTEPPTAQRAQADGQTTAQDTAADAQPRTAQSLAAVNGELHALLALGINSAMPPPERMDHARHALADIPPESIWVRSMAHFAQAMLLTEHGRAADAVNELTTTIHATIHAADPVNAILIVRLHGALLHVLLHDGRLNALRHVAQQLAKLAQAEQLLSSVAWANYALAYMAHEQGDLAHAYDLLAPIANLHTPADFVCRVDAIQRLIPIAAALGRLADVIDEVRALIAHTEQSERAERAGVLEALLAYANLLAGKREHAFEWVNSAMVSDDSAALSWLSLRQIQATILLAQATPTGLTQAATILRGQLSTMLHTHNVYYSVPLAVQLACVHQAAGRRHAALNTLAQALEIGYPRGYRRTFLNCVPGCDSALRELLHELARMRDQHDAIRTAARDLLAVAAATPGTTLSGAPSAASPHAAPAKTNDLVALPIEPLSMREEEVLTLLGEQMTNKEIARELGVSPLTVRNHASRLYRKLGVNGRKEAVKLGKRLGLLGTGLSPSASQLLS